MASLWKKEKNVIFEKCDTDKISHSLDLLGYYHQRQVSLNLNTIMTSIDDLFKVQFTHLLRVIRGVLINFLEA